MRLDWFLSMAVSSVHSSGNQTPVTFKSNCTIVKEDEEDDYIPILTSFFSKNHQVQARQEGHSRYITGRCVGL